MGTTEVDGAPEVAAEAAAVIAAQREFATRLQGRVLPDPLTGLPVRSMLVDRLERMLAYTGPNTGRLAVLCCDLDGLPSPTTTDASQATAARTQAVGRLVCALRQGDVAARVGPRTVVLLCPGIVRAQDAHGIAQRVVEAFSAPLQLPDGSAVPVWITAGLTLSGPRSTAGSLLTEAHAALARELG